MISRKFGWFPDTPDQRDFTYMVPAIQVLPPAIDLVDRNPVLDQGGLGSCTANAIASAYRFELDKLAGTRLHGLPSRLFIYYNERFMEGTIKSDAGAMIRDGFKSINRDGVCSETAWPYRELMFTRKPSQSCYQSARHHHALSYQRVPRSLEMIKSSLAAHHPVVIGFSVYETFMNMSPNGLMLMPVGNDRLLGGHAVAVFGYDDATSRFKVKNSWGPNWGDNGYFYMPYKYLMDPNLSDDFWNLNIVN